MLGIYLDDSVKDKMHDLINGQAFMYHNHNTKLIRFPNTGNLSLQDRLFRWSSVGNHVDLYSPGTLSSIKASTANYTYTETGTDISIEEAVDILFD